MPPTVSIIVPAYNDPSGLDETVSCLLRQTHSDHDLHIVDNNSVDNTINVAEDYATNHQQVYLHRETEVQGPGAARNKGIKKSDGHILGFLDCGMRVDDEWIETAVDELHQKDVDYLAGEVRNEIDGYPNLIARYNYVTAFDSKRYFEQNNFGLTGNLFVRREVFENLGFFDDRLTKGGDVEFGKRVYNSEYQTAYSPEFPAVHPTRDSLSSMLNNSIRSGRAQEQLRQYHPEVGMRKLRRSPLPPNPVHFVHNVIPPHTEEVPYRDKIAFYLLVYLAKLGETYGGIKERIGS